MNQTLPAIVPIAMFPLVFHWMPLVRRNCTWFSVTVAPGFPESPAARTVLHRFQIAIWLLALAAVAVTALSPEAILPWTLPLAITLEIAGSLAAFAYARRLTLPHAVAPSPMRSAALLTVPEGMPGGAAAVIFPFAILGAAALYLYLNWSIIPERIPVHWGFDGVPDDWSARDWLSVYGPLLMGAAISVLMLLIGFGILHASPRGRVPANAAASAQIRRITLQLLVAIVKVLALLVAGVSVTRVHSQRPFGELPPLLCSLGLMALVVPYVWRLIRINRTISGGGDGTPDQCWKLGMFYFNPADPAIFVEKRLGLGYTCNFGNRATWLTLGLIAFCPLIPILLRYL